MEIVFHGAAQTVTGSQHLIRVNGSQILLDCGLFQGSRAIAFERNTNFPFDAQKIDAVVLSHAHIDHSGNLPNLVKNGFRGPIFATRATHDLCNHMLMDSAHIQESDVEFTNKRHVKRGEPANAKPLYTQVDAQEALSLFRDGTYNTPFEVAPGVRATYYEAGHILGAAMMVLDIEEGGRTTRLAFSGDLGRRNIPILRDPTFLRSMNIDYAIMESTYGTKNHRPPEQAAVEFRAIAKETLERGGRLIIPSFAVGRAQEIVYDLHQMVNAREIPAVPVYVDSPLAVNASDVFKRHVELFDEQTQAFIRNESDHDAFGFGSLKYTRSVDESKAINNQQGPAVIISASGMCEAGRILHHLRNNIDNPRNTIVIVSWQAPNTLGRRLADREKTVKIFGEVHKVRAQVETINGFSGHAGRDLLIEWAQALGPQLKGLFLVHGEPESSAALAAALKESGLENTVAPELHSRVVV